MLLFFLSLETKISHKGQGQMNTEFVVALRFLLQKVLQVDALSNDVLPCCNKTLTKPVWLFVLKVFIQFSKHLLNLALTNFPLGTTTE